jgi:multidrug efflux system membrane fusion protein
MMSRRARYLVFTIPIIGLWHAWVSAAELPAVMAWGQRVELGTLVSGVVSEVPVGAGQRVERGAVLLRLDPRGFRARLARAEAAVARARVRLEEAQREDERAIELYERTVLAERERQLAAIALEEARAELQAAEAQRVQARLDQERSVIRAPFGGVVVRVDAAPGQVIISELQSRALVVLADDRQMQAVARIPAGQIERLASVSEVTVEVRGARLAGGAPQIGLEPEPAGGEGPNYALRVPVQIDPDIRLRSGEPAKIQIPD